ncbi:hypothetical protein E2C01_046574 [Portunus trituberculatus]|uniref:Uncharacterized protein n=1 Tax=Portunus trituberculatus TaxID=210409 RepID=A0A5B7G6J1_PORTR|nr:hypothetical protein [Portunus trituberculatus]
MYSILYQQTDIIVKDDGDTVFTDSCLCSNVTEDERGSRGSYRSRSKTVEILEYSVAAHREVALIHGSRSVFPAIEKQSTGCWLVKTSLMERSYVGNRYYVRGSCR